MRTKCCEGGVELVVSDKLISAHAFSTRLGGVSEEAHTASLNLAFGRGDDRDTVLENLRIFSNAVGFEPSKLISVTQIHSAQVRIVDEGQAGEGYFREDSFECDGYVTASSNLPIGVKTADCVPILMEGIDESGAVVCVAAVHAGWRGTVGRIAAVAVEKMAAFGVPPERVRAAMGAAICERCFEVREDFCEEFTAILGKDSADRYLRSDSEMKGVWHVDLREINRDILISCGVSENNIDISRECTCCLPERYFSHRYSKGKRGTMLSVIMKK